MSATPSAGSGDEEFVRAGDDRVRLLRDGTAAFPAMLDAIARAREEILLEMYWIGGDTVGRRFRDALAERAAAGVVVRVLFDSVGSFETPEAFWGPLSQAGAEVQEYSPVSPLKRSFGLRRLPYRDHRKLLVVDRATAFAGGINLGDAWAPPSPPRLPWRDDCVEVRGPAARELAGAFFDVWRRIGRTVPKDAPSARATSGEGRPVRVLTNRVGTHPHRRILQTYLFALRHATRSVDITSAYFLPGPRFLRALRGAARRGVRVRLLVPAHADVQIVALAMSSLYGRLLGDGVEIYAYTPRVLHAKTAVFDVRYTLVGSHNLDSASSRFNLECDLLVDSTEFAGVVHRSFERDVLEARRLELSEWRRRPRWLRAVGWFAALFERVL